MSARERLSGARLYLVCDARPREFLDAALRGGVDVIQLRDKSLDDAGLATAAREFRAAADAAGALFVLNDRPDLVAACGADGVHVGQEDADPAQARAAVGPDRIVGRSTHSPAQLAAAEADPDVDYVAVGPVHETPTKPGRPAAGLGYVEHAARAATKPWFAIGGIDAGTLGPVLDGGARRIVVVRAIAGADDPEAAARGLREALDARDEPPRGYARSRARNDAIRAGLLPVGPDERPLALRLSALVAALIAVGNVVAVVAGATVDGRRPVGAALVVAALMAAFAAGLWQKRYLAVLAWEALLAVTLVYATLSLMLASNVAAVLVCVGLIAVAGPLFWFLIRIMARLQVPPTPDE